MAPCCVGVPMPLASVHTTLVPSKITSYGPPPAGVSTFAVDAANVYYTVPTGPNAVGSVDLVAIPLAGGAAMTLASAIWPAGGGAYVRTFRDLEADITF